MTVADVVIVLVVVVAVFLKTAILWLGLWASVSVSCLSPLCQNESSCETIHLKMSSISNHLDTNQTYFHSKGFTSFEAVELGNSEMAYGVSKNQSQSHHTSQSQRTKTIQ